MLVEFNILDIFSYVTLTLIVTLLNNILLILIPMLLLALIIYLTHWTLIIYLTHLTPFFLMNLIWTHVFDILTHIRSLYIFVKGMSVVLRVRGKLVFDILVDVSDGILSVLVNKVCVFTHYYPFDCSLHVH